MRQFLSALFLLLAALSSEQHYISNDEGRAAGRKNGRQFNSEGSRSLLHKGVYIPDARFNAFVDGVMVNMIQEMKKQRLDPLYFRVADDGSVEHVPTHGRRNPQSIGRIRRQAKSALGGGVVRGLSHIRRFGDAEVQTAGNITLIRSHWLIGPLSFIIDYRGDPSITRVKTELKAVQFDTLTSIDKFGAQKEEFRLNSPLFEYMAYYGNRTLNQQKLTELVIKFLLSESSFLMKFLEETFEIASYDKIIPQFGADDNYYTVLQYLFSDHKNIRTARISQNQVKDSQIASLRGQVAVSGNSQATTSRESQATASEDFPFKGLQIHESNKIDLNEK